MPRQSRIGDAGAIRHLLDLGDRKMGSFLIQTRNGNASNNLLREERTNELARRMGKSMAPRLRISRTDNCPNGDPFLMTNMRLCGTPFHSTQKPKRSFFT